MGLSLRTQLILSQALADNAAALEITNALAGEPETPSTPGAAIPVLVDTGVTATDITNIVAKVNVIIAEIKAFGVTN